MGACLVGIAKKIPHRSKAVVIGVRALYLGEILCQRARHVTATTSGFQASLAGQFCFGQQIFAKCPRSPWWCWKIVRAVGSLDPLSHDGVGRILHDLKLAWVS